MLIKLIIMGTAILIICSVDLSHLVLDDSTERLLYFEEDENEENLDAEGETDESDEIRDYDLTSEDQGNNKNNESDDVKDSSEENSESVQNSEQNEKETEKIQNVDLVPDDFDEDDDDLLEAEDLMKKIYEMGGGK